MYRASFLLLIICLTLVSCGKKGPPTLKAYEKPETPINLTAIHREDKIILSWSHTDKRKNLNGFHVFKSEGGEFKNIAFVAAGRYSYEDTDFKTGVSYRYKIIAQTLKNVFSDDSNAITVKPEAVPPAPKDLSAQVGNNALNISWKDSGNGIFYNIYKTSDKGKYGLNPMNNEPLKTSSYTDNLELTKPVYYTVRAILTAGIRHEGPPSNEIEVNPSDFTPSKPRGLQTITAEDKTVITWEENPETWTTKYRVYRKTAEAEGFKLVAEPFTPTFTIREKTGKKHTYRITAVGPIKESPPSESVVVDF